MRGNIFFTVEGLLIMMPISTVRWEAEAWKHLQRRYCFLPPSSSPDRTVYVEGYPSTMGHEEIRNLFIPFGQVEWDVSLRYMLRNLS